MKLNKNIAVVVSLAGLVAVSYFGIGAYNKQGEVHAEVGEVDLSTDAAKLGYTIGAQIGRDLLQGGMASEIDIDALVSALKVSATGGELQLTDEDMMAAQQAFQMKRQAEYETMMAANKEKGDAFIAQVKEKEGVTATNTGLLYEVLTAGSGASAGANDTVRIHYSGKLMDGTVFDSSYERNEPAEFPVSGVIPGFSEGLQLMQPGGKYRLTIPSELAYAERAPESIGPNQPLVFDVELLEVLNKEQATSE